MARIPTDDGMLYRATVIDLKSGRPLGAAIGLYPDARLACDAIRWPRPPAAGDLCATTESQGRIFHTDEAPLHRQVVHQTVP
jgi:transposase InsO family protein